MTQSSPIACEEFLLDLEKTFSISLNHIKTMISEFHAEMWEK